MSKHQMYDFPDTPSDQRRAERDMTLTIIVAGLQRVLRGEHTPEQQRLILRNAAMLLADLGLENGHEIG